MRCIYVILFSVTVSHAANKSKSLNHDISHNNENTGATKYRGEKILDPRNTHEKHFGPTKYSRENFWTHEITKRKNFEPTKNPRQKISDPHTTHESTMALDSRSPRRHVTHEN